MLKGKTEPVVAYRLARACTHAPERRHDTPFVGRDRELAQLRETPGSASRPSGAARSSRSSATPGVGKSRLVAEALASIEATVVRGRCLPYGEGITYWPVVEVLKQLDVRPPDEIAADGDPLAARRERAHRPQPRRSPGRFARRSSMPPPDRPLVVVFDDIQWGEETFHDLIEHVALLSTGRADPAPVHGPAGAHRAPPHLAGDAPTRAPRRPTTSTSSSARAFPASCASGSPARRAATRSSSARCSRWRHETDGEVVVPPTLQALLAARFDQLEPAERHVLECGAIEGEIFHRGAVQALSPAETQVTPRLAALVRKELIRPDRPQLVGEDGFRFRHLLIRDAAYEALPKATRADLHQRFAVWLEDHGTEARRAGRAPRLPPRASLPLPRRARTARRRRRLAAAARQTPHSRRPRAASAPGLHRAPSACSSAPPRSCPRPRSISPLETELGDVLFWTGRGRRGAPARGCPRRARRRRRATRSASCAGGSSAGVLRLCTRAGGRDRAAGRARRAGAARCSRPPATTSLCTSDTRALGRWRQCAQRRRRSAGGVRARRRPRTTGGPAARVRCGRRSSFRFDGHDTRRRTLLAWLDERALREPADHFWLVPAAAGALAMLGRFDEARAILAEARAELAERGGGLLLARSHGIRSPSTSSSWPAIPPPPPSSEQKDAALLEELGEQGLPSRLAAAMLAQALYALDRLEEADSLGRSRGGARRERRRRTQRFVATGQGEGARASRRACRRPSGSRARRSAIGDETDDAQRCRATRTPTSREVLAARRASATWTQPPRSSRRSNATSARATSSSARERDYGLASRELQDRRAAVGATPRYAEAAFASATCASSAVEDVPDLLVDQRLQHALPHRPDRAGDLDVRLPCHRGRVALTGQGERRRHVHHRADALALAVQRRVLERPLLELLEVHRHLEPAEAERHLHLCRPVTIVGDLEALDARHGLRHLRGVVENRPDDLAGGGELLRTFNFHFEVTSTFSRVRSGCRSISHTRW